MVQTGQLAFVFAFFALHFFALIALGDGADDYREDDRRSYNEHKDHHLRGKVVTLDA